MADRVGRDFSDHAIVALVANDEPGSERLSIASVKYARGYVGGQPGASGALRRLVSQLMVYEARYRLWADRAFKSAGAPVFDPTCEQLGGEIPWADSADQEKIPLDKQSA